MQASPERFNARARTLVEDPDWELLLSAASAWEIAIKYAIGKLLLPDAPAVYVPSRMAASGVDPLPVRMAHALRVAALPLHHRDPFDRMLVAQAQLEALPILTADDAFEAYDLEVIRAER